MTDSEKYEILNMFFDNYSFVQKKEVYMNGVYGENAEATCAAALTIIEYLTNIKGGQTK